MSISSTHGLFSPVYTSELIKRLHKHHQKAGIPEITIEQAEEILLTAKIIPCTSKTLILINELCGLTNHKTNISQSINTAYYKFFESMQMSLDYVYNPKWFATALRGHKELYDTIETNLSYEECIQVGIKTGERMSNTKRFFWELRDEELDFEFDQDCSIVAKMMEVLGHIIDEQLNKTIPNHERILRNSTQGMKQSALNFIAAYRDVLGELSQSRGIDLYAVICGYPSGYQQMKTHASDSDTDKTNFTSEIHLKSRTLFTDLECFVIEPEFQALNIYAYEFEYSYLDSVYSQTHLMDTIRKRLQVSRTKGAFWFEIYKTVFSASVRSQTENTKNTGRDLLPYLKNRGLSNSMTRTIMKEEALVLTLMEYFTHHGSQYWTIPESEIRENLITNHSEVNSKNIDHYTQIAVAFGDLLNDMSENPLMISKCEISNQCNKIKAGNMKALHQHSFISR